MTYWHVYCSVMLLYIKYAPKTCVQNKSILRTRMRTVCWSERRGQIRGGRPAVSIETRKQTLRTCSKSLVSRFQ